MATYSFDHRWILFRRGSSGAFGKMSLMVMSAEGGEPELLHEEVDLESIAWRPDNRHVVFQSDTTLNDIDVVTKRTRQLASLTKKPQGISISSGGRMMYSDFWHYQFLYEVDLESGERRQITSHAKGNGGARFSPDGRTIAYASNRTDNEEIWLHHLDGRQETQLTGDGRRYVNPEWSPDGKRLVFKSELEDGTQKMFVANVDGAGGVRALADQRVGGGLGVNSARRIRWSPDGELIGFPVAGDAGPEWWTIHPDGSDARSGSTVCRSSTGTRTASGRS